MAYLSGKDMDILDWYHDAVMGRDYAWAKRLYMQANPYVKMLMDVSGTPALRPEIPEFLQGEVLSFRYIHDDGRELVKIVKLCGVDVASPP